MKAVLVIDLNDDVNLEEAEIRYAIHDKYGMPIKTEVDGCHLKQLPQKKNTDFHPNIVYANGWNDCLEEIK